MSSTRNRPAAIRRVFTAAWQDRARVLAALISAGILWYLIGQRIMVTSQPIPCAVRPLQDDVTDPLAPGLWVRLPEELVFVGSVPEQLALELRGTTEQVTAIQDGALGGVFSVPEDFCGDDDEKTAEVEVTSNFKFPMIEARQGLHFVKRTSVTLTIARRDRMTIALDRANLAGIDELLGDKAEVEVPNTLLEVSGPRALIARLRSSAARLLVELNVDRNMIDRLPGPVAVRLGEPYLVDASGIVGRGLLRIRGDDTSAVKVTVYPVRKSRVVRFTEVEILALIPSRARRENVNWENPLSIKPPTIDLKVTVPEAYFATRQEADLRRDVEIYVNLGELDPGLEGADLRLHCVGLPPGATVEPAQDKVDVAWVFAESR